MSFLSASKNYVENGSPTRYLPAKEWRSRSGRQPEAADRRLQPSSSPSALENRGIAAAPHDRLIGNDDSRARFDGVVDLVRKLRVDSEARRDLLGRNAAAPAGHGHPPARGAPRSERALAIGSAFEQREDMVPERSTSVNLDGGAPDRIAIAIDVTHAVGGADAHRDRSARAALWVPVVAIIRERAQHLRRKILWREHQSGIRCEMRHGRFAVTDHDGAALRRLTEKQLREIERQANATMAGRVTGQIARVHGNASPGQPLHVWHRRVVVFFRVVLLLFLEDADDSARFGAVFRASAHGLTANEDAVPINVHR